MAGATIGAQTIPIDTVAMILRRIHRRAHVPDDRPGQHQTGRTARRLDDAARDQGPDGRGKDAQERSRKEDAEPGQEDGAPAVPVR